jgi:hypothetical protein
MRDNLAKPQVKKWLRDQGVAMRWVERERARFLLRLTPEQSARIYLSLDGSSADGRNRSQPSPVLWDMRKVLERCSRRREKRRA